MGVMGKFSSDGAGQTLVDATAAYWADPRYGDSFVAAAIGLLEPRASEGGPPLTHSGEEQPRTENNQHDRNKYKTDKYMRDLPRNNM